MKLKTILSSGAFCSAVFLGAQAQAEEASPLSYSVSLDYNSHFMSYGANVWAGETETIGDGHIFNPSAGVEYAVSETSAIYAGIWADVNTFLSGNVKGPFTSLGSDIQEVDLWIGYYFSIDKFTFDFTYQAWLYNGQNEGIVDFAISYDTMFAPYIKFHNRVETATPGQQKGTMIEIGGTLYEGEFKGISYGFFAGLGFSLDDYHNVNKEDGYAYSFIGASASYVIYSSDSVEVDLHGGLTYYNTDEDAIPGNPDEDILTGNVGVGFSF